ncbi:MAG: hypothetical protein VX764_10705 [Planctomycetota bacterium]|nr:hypothetical protein [Planctomycetota bacterium]
MNFRPIHPCSMVENFSKKYCQVLLLLAVILIPTALVAQGPCTSPFTICQTNVDGSGLPIHMPITEGMTVSTFSDCLDVCQYVVAVYDTSDVSTAPGTDVNWAPFRYSGPGDPTDPANTDAWTAANLGPIFGIALSDEPSPSIYVTATPIRFPVSACPSVPFGDMGPGGVYKLDGLDGTICPIAALPTSFTGSGAVASLGQVDHYTLPDGKERLYVSSFEDGLIYMIPLPQNCVTPVDNNTLPTFDHGIEGRVQELDGQGNPLTPIVDTPETVLTPHGRRIWGLRINEPESRLYYAVWNTTVTGIDPNADNEIWSVEINPLDGDFVPNSARREITIPELNGFEFPVADIAFECGNRMVFSQRGVNTILGDSQPHEGLTLEYTGSHLAWVASDTDKFHVGNVFDGTNACGGIDFDADGNVIATGNALHLTTGSAIYGFAIIPSTGSNVIPLPAGQTHMQDSYLVDVDCDISTGGLDKTKIFDVECYRPVSNNCGTGCRTDNATVLCGSEDNTGDFTLTFDVVNNSGFEVHKLLIPGLVGGIAVSPNIIDMVPPLANGDTAIGIQLTLTGGNAGDIVCIPMSLMSKDDAGELFECCGTEVCIEIPPCCLSITGESIALDADGNSVYTFTVTNLAGEAPNVADHLFMDVVSPAGVTITDEWQALPSLADGSSTQLSTVIIGAQPGQEICFQITIHDATLNECCGIVHCITMPGGEPGPGPCIPDLVCKPVGDIDGDDILEVVLQWTVPATDDCCPGDMIILANDVVVGSANPFAGSVTIDCIDGQICIACNNADGTLEIQACCDVVCQPFLPPPVEFLRADSNSDGSFDIADVVQTLNFLFHAEVIPCLVALDANDDNSIDIADAIFSLEALFSGGPTPWPPYQNCGVDETPGDLNCETFPACINSND